jgi:hypothetical protein
LEQQKKCDDERLRVTEKKVRQQTNRIKRRLSSNHYYTDHPELEMHVVVSPAEWAFLSLPVVLRLY